jgi:hypothetical protein
MEVQVIVCNEVAGSNPVTPQTWYQVPIGSKQKLLVGFENCLVAQQVVAPLF